MNAKTCPICQSPIPDNAPGGLCPACVLRDADEPSADAADAPSLADVAAAFPKLEIIRLIGHGGMGYVYQARQPELDRTVALKILSPTLRADPAFEERFAREARVLGKLQHPNIVTLFEHGESGGYFYLLMEYIDGVNLRQAMSAGRFTPEQALAIVPAICDALQSAHAEGVWHRDIKPENILLDRDGRVKIADFGIARILGDPQRNFTLTRTGGMLGSAAYMAPEQHENPHSVDHRADIYSLGVVIYEMLTGELPLGRFPLPSQRAAVNARIDEIVMRTLEKERELRQQSAEEVKTDVQGVGNNTNPGSSSRTASAKLRFSFFGPAAMIAGGVFLQIICHGLGQAHETVAIVIAIIGRFSVALGVVVAVLAIYERKPRMWVSVSGVIVGLGTIIVVAAMFPPFMIVGLMLAAMVFGALGLIETRRPELNNTRTKREQGPQRVAEVKTVVSGQRSGKTALALFLAGLFGVPLLKSPLGLQEVILLCSLAFVSAFVLGVMGWRTSRGKFAAIASGVALLVLPVITVTFLIRPQRVSGRMTEARREQETKAASVDAKPEAQGDMVDDIGPKWRLVEGSQKGGNERVTMLRGPMGSEITEGGGYHAITVHIAGHPLLMVILNSREDLKIGTSPDRVEGQINWRNFRVVEANRATLDQDTYDLTLGRVFFNRPNGTFRQIAARPERILSGDELKKFVAALPPEK